MFNVSLQTLLQSCNVALLRDADDRAWWCFAEPIRTLQADTLSDVLPLLAEMERLTQNQSLFAVGYIAYEAARAFDPALHTKSPVPIPLAWFGIYEHPRVFPASSLICAAPATRPTFTSELSASQYDRAFHRIREYIAAGDTYQVNYTWRLRTRWEDSPASIFMLLQRAQPTPYSAFLRLPGLAACSISPELFFALNQSIITCRPMKGTRARGLSVDDDVRLREELRISRKDRAENLMILDMMRNDLSRIAHHGSVRVRSLFDIEKHATVWQMTSTVTAETSAPLTEIMRALFPCASITGAPKIRTMQIIAELEASPRGLYTGVIGYVAPQRHARFSVAIRTLVMDDGGRAEYGVGGGIVWDSTPEAEYAEGMAKARILTEDAAPFEILETILWDPHSGYLFKELHLQRMAASADYFGYPFCRETIENVLRDAIANEPGDATRVIRLLLNGEGGVRAETRAAPQPFCHDPVQSVATCKVAIAREPVSSNNRFLYHKTTRREAYERAKAGVSTDDVLLWNERGEITESSIANVVAVFDNEWITPPITSGLLPGVFRTYLLQTAKIRERVLKREDISKADALYLINSIRGWVRCALT